MCILPQQGKGSVHCGDRVLELQGRWRWGMGEVWQSGGRWAFHCRGLISVAWRSQYILEVVDTAKGEFEMMVLKSLEKDAVIWSGWSFKYVSRRTGDKKDCENVCLCKWSFRFHVHKTSPERFMVGLLFSLNPHLKMYILILEREEGEKERDRMESERDIDERETSTHCLL